MKDKKLDFLMETYKDCRSEIEMRIGQRDTFALQYIVAAGAVISLGLFDFAQSAYLFFLLPFITLFFAVQIMYSYSIHDRLHDFISTHLEPEIAKTLGYSQSERQRLFWESYCEVDSLKKTLKTPGIRKGFFVKMSYLSPLISGALFILVGISKNMYTYWQVTATVGIAVTVFSYLAILFVLNGFNKKADAKTLDRLASLDYIKSDREKSHTPCKALFLDRDGTIHIDKIQTHKIEDLEYFGDTFTSIKRMSDLGYKIVIITNQNGIRQQKYTAGEMHAFNQKIVDDFKNHGIDVEAIYYSPYEAKDGHISFKPRPGMLIRACHELNVDLFNSYLIGDQLTDVIAAERVGVKGVMVTTGIYKNKEKDGYKTADYYEQKPLTAKSLSDAVEIIYRDLTE